MSMRKILLLPRIKIHNANALSSPFTIGFPAMTAWLGASHFLQRKLVDRGFKVTFMATGVVSHQFDLQTYRGKRDYVSSIVGTGNPLDKTGARSSFIEEARCHLEVSLIIEINGIEKDQESDFQNSVEHILHSKMKIAGGDIRGFDSPKVNVIDENNETDFRVLKRKLMPGYVLTERRDLMIHAMEEGQDAMDAMLDYLAIHHMCEINEKGNIVWSRGRKAQGGKKPGWIVPVATGFQGISALDNAKNQRDPDTLHRFAESVITLGEFKMSYRVTTLEEMLWEYQVDKKNDLYQCVQKPANILTQEDDYI